MVSILFIVLVDVFGKEENLDALLAELGVTFELTVRRRNYSIGEYAMNLTPGKVVVPVLDFVNLKYKRYQNIPPRR